jgi:hypothetical protein
MHVYVCSDSRVLALHVHCAVSATDLRIGRGPCGNAWLDGEITTVVTKVKGETELGGSEHRDCHIMTRDSP